MFQWDKSIKSLDIAIGEVVQLFRSMRDVQLALPGLPAQEATAYLCQYQASRGIGTVVAFQLHKSRQLAFYVDAPHVVSPAQAEAVVDKALVFVESMGFLMTDLDVQLLGESDRKALWSSVPLQQGDSSPAQSPPAEPEPAATARPRETAASPAATTPEPDRPVAAPAKAGEEKPALAEAAAPLPAPEGAGQSGDVDDLLAAVEALRTRRPGLRSRKKTPGPEELQRRRQELRNVIGRILASL